ncbi:hypothetical protein [Bacillus cereus]|uniref:hypothetical protein n=1 Tax=Bacillus cereus TaxID=1396 RepID=UPI00396F1486
MSLTTIGTDEHVFLSGQTGTGKSFTAEVYLSGVTDVDVVKLDTKGKCMKGVKRKNQYGVD